MIDKNHLVPYDLYEDEGNDISVEILSEHPQLGSDILYDIGVLCADMYSDRKLNMKLETIEYDIMIYMSNNAKDRNDCGFYTAAVFSKGIKIDEVHYIIHRALNDSQYLWH